MVIGQNWIIMSNFTDKDVYAGLSRIEDATTKVDSVMSGLGLDPVGDFMINMALKESWAGAGYDPTAPHTYGPWQIDPIMMFDIQKNIRERDTHQERASAINNYMQSIGYENFDIGSIASVKKDGNKYSYTDKGQYANDPLVNAFLTRLALSSIEEKVPTSLQGHGEYWKKHWNKSGAGKAHQLVDMVNIWRPVDATMQNNANIQKAFTK
jgi:hypothetical protein